jgi:hypothetical protein
MDTATYIKALVTPQAKKANTSRRVWSIDLETVWLPFFMATNVMGDTPYRMTHWAHRYGSATIKTERVRF